jgi:transcriptional regulator with XRE-family HTH domain
VRADLLDIARRLRAHRRGAGMSADEAADRLHVSRAALYRFEKFGINQLETLERVAKLLDVSLGSLLGVGVEYTSSVATYLERYRQIEENAEWLFVVFGPISYVLTSDEYDQSLRSALFEDMAQKFSPAQALQLVSNVIAILKKRKAAYRKRRTFMTNVICASDIVRFARSEFSVGDNPVDEQRLAAGRRELARIAEMFRHPPLGVQLGLVFQPLPTTSFSIVQERDRSTVLISPFRLGPEINARSGVAMITSADDAVKLHREVCGDLWKQAVTGSRAVEFVHSQIEESQRA